MAEARCLAVKNFAKFQHYHDRHPPWIKLYGEVLSDVAFLQLPEAAQAQLVKLWVLASQFGHPLPNNPRLLAGKIGARGRFYIGEIIRAGFLIPCDEDASGLLAESASLASDGASKPLADLEQNASATPARTRARARARGERGEKREENTATATTSRSRKKPRAEGCKTASRKSSWLAPFANVWEKENGAGSFASVAGQAAKALRPLVDAGHETAEIARYLENYLSETEPRFQSLAKFAQTYSRWDSIFGEPPVDEFGVMSEEFERMTRPPGA